MRILLLNQNHIGDALFTTPAIAALRAIHPDAFIVNATLAGLAPLFQGNPLITENWSRPRTGNAEFLGFAGRVRRGRFDAVVALSASSTQFGLFALISGANTRIGFSHPGVRRFLTHAVPLRPKEQHHADDHLDQVRIFGPVEGRFPLEVFPQPGWECEWRAVRDTLDLDPERPLIALNPGATVPRKQWLEDRWAALSDRLLESGYQPLLFGGPGDRALVEGIRALSRNPAPSAQGHLGLGGLAAAARSCDAFVSGDTGPMHLAVAVGTPVVALHGPTNPRRTGPYTERAVVLWHPEPGTIHGSMESISVDEVAEAVFRVSAVSMRPLLR